MEHATIHLERKKTWSDFFRSYKIIIDDKLVGTIRHKKRCSFELEPGYHDIFLMVDWLSSSHLSLNLAPGEEVKLICHGNDPAQALYDITFNAQNHIKLYQEQ